MSTTGSGGFCGSGIQDSADVNRFGLKSALALGIIQPEATVMAVQGWKGGLGHVSALLTCMAFANLLQTNTLRILSYV
jgi:hypothetical protein